MTVVKREGIQVRDELGGLKSALCPNCESADYVRIDTHFERVTDSWSERVKVMRPSQGW